MCKVLPLKHWFNVSNERKRNPEEFWTHWLWKMKVWDVHYSLTQTTLQLPLLLYLFVIRILARKHISKYISEWGGCWQMHARGFSVSSSFLFSVFFFLKRSIITVVVAVAVIFFLSIITCIWAHLAKRFNTASFPYMSFHLEDLCCLEISYYLTEFCFNCLWKNFGG